MIWCRSDYDWPMRRSVLPLDQPEEHRGTVGQNSWRRIIGTKENCGVGQPWAGNVGRTFQLEGMRGAAPLKGEAGARSA